MNLIIDARMVHKELHGIARYTYELINNLARDYKVNLTLLTNNEEESRALFIAHKNLNYITMKSKFLSPKEQFELPRLLNKYSKNYIFHSPSFSSSPFLKIKSIMTIHDLNHIRYPQFYTPLHRYYYNFIVKPCALKCSKILTVSQFSKRELLEWLKCDEEKISVTYNGIDGKFSREKDETKLEAIRKKYKLPKNFVLYVGNQKPHKNVEVLVRAMQYVESDIKLVMNGKYTENISAIIDEKNLKDKIQAIGFIEDEDLPILYSCAHLFVFPSLYEGFGLPPLEAMACGCPAIVADTSSLPEAVGEAAIKFKATDYEALGKAINEILNNEELKNKLVADGLEQAARYKWKETAALTYNIYKELWDRQ